MLEESLYRENKDYSYAVFPPSIQCHESMETFNWTSNRWNINNSSAIYYCLFCGPATKVGVVCFMANLEVLMFDELGV